VKGEVILEKKTAERRIRGSIRNLKRGADQDPKAGGEKSEGEVQVRSLYFWGRANRRAGILKKGGRCSINTGKPSSEGLARAERLTSELFTRIQPRGYEKKRSNVEKLERG